MKSRIISAFALAACACVLTGPSPRVAAQESQEKQPPVKVSGGERDAAEKINKAKGPEAKIQAAAEFIKKYPKSALRPQVASYVAGEISRTEDAQLKASLAETYLSLFTEAGEPELVQSSLIIAYLAAERAADAFRAAPAWLAKNPDDVDVLRRLTNLASNASIRGDHSLVQQGLQYGRKAAELLETDKMPAGTDPARWAAYKTEALPTLYRELGVLALRAGDRAAMAAYMRKAAEHKSDDPAVYIILSDIANEEYRTLANQYKIAPAGAERDALLKKVEGQLDKVIELYAQTVALTEGNAQYKEAHDQMRQDLEAYYKFRHNNSTAGMQELINKFKAAPATP